MPAADPASAPGRSPDGPPAPPPGALAREEEGHGDTITLAHGFTQTRRLWGGLDRRLAARFRVRRVDLPGHGDSAGIRAGVPEAATGLVDAGGPGAYLGYSMGARHCLRAALDHPEAVTSLVLISGTAGLEDPPGAGDPSRRG